MQYITNILENKKQCVDHNLTTSVETEDEDDIPKVKRRRKTKKQNEDYVSDYVSESDGELVKENVTEATGMILWYGLSLRMKDVYISKKNLYTIYQMFM